MFYFAGGEGGKKRRLTVNSENWGLETNLQLMVTTLILKIHLLPMFWKMYMLQFPRPIVNGDLSCSWRVLIDNFAKGGLVGKRDC